MRNRTAADLTTLLRAEIGDLSGSVVSDTEQDARYRAILSRVYQTLHEEHDWIFLQAYRDVAMTTDVKIYDFPADLDIDRVETAWSRSWATGGNADDSYFYLVDHGIGPRELNSRRTGGPEGRPYAWDSARDIVSNPDSTGHNKFEVWPTPTFDAGTQVSVRFYGTRALEVVPLNLVTDICEMDDNLVVLHAAAELLERRESPDAISKRAAATKLLDRLKSNSVKTKPFTLGGESGGNYNEGYYDSSARFYWSPGAR